MRYRFGAMATALSDGTSIQIGTHSLARDGSIVKMTMCGELTLEQTLEILAHYQALLEEQGYVLIVLDVAQARGMAMPARKASAEWGKTYGDQSRSAVIGAPFVIRTAMELMNRAANVLARRSRSVPLGFFATEDEARSWLLSQIPIIEHAARKA